MLCLTAVAAVAASCRAGRKALKTESTDPVTPPLEIRTGPVVTGTLALSGELVEADVVSRSVEGSFSPGEAIAENSKRGQTKEIGTISYG